jgi:pantoate--beta-alanine ligase
VREPDGLAMSSRNRNLTNEQRVQALVLWRSLASVRASVDAGEHDAGVLRENLRRVLNAADGVRVEYAEIVNPDTLEPLADVRDGALIAVAAHVGATRLIDNIVLPPASGGSSL